MCKYNRYVRRVYNTDDISLSYDIGTLFFTLQNTTKDK